jgi:nitroreductase
VDIYEAIRLRKSVRSYRDKPIEESKLARILEATRLAPSASNRQEWRFIVVQDVETRRELAKAANNQSFLAEAAAIIVCCAATSDHTMPCGIKSFAVDVSIAIDHLTLAAAAEGLGTCWIGAFDPEQVKAILGIPKDVVVVELLPIGYPEDGSPKEKSRLALNEIVRYERW